jgi:hypothetical protein
MEHLENSGIDKRLILKGMVKGENGEVGSIILKWIIKKGGKVCASSMSRRIDYCEYGNAHSGKKKSRALSCSRDLHFQRICTMQLLCYNSRLTAADRLSFI